MLRILPNRLARIAVCHLAETVGEIDLGIAGRRTDSGRTDSRARILTEPAQPRRRVEILSAAEALQHAQPSLRAAVADEPGQL